MDDRIFSNALFYEDQERDISEILMAVGKVMDKIFLPLIFDETLENEEAWREEWAAEIEEIRTVIKGMVEAKIESRLSGYICLFEAWKQIGKETAAIEAAAMAKTLPIPEVRQKLVWQAPAER